MNDEQPPFWTSRKLGRCRLVDAMWTHHKLKRNEQLQEDAEKPGRVWTERS